jgi:hypothetical protein
MNPPHPPFPAPQSRPGGAPARRQVRSPLSFVCTLRTFHPAALLILFFPLLLWMRFVDAQHFEIERNVRLSFLNVSALLNMPNSKGSLDEMVADAKSGRADFVYKPAADNPLPEFLPDYPYIVSPERTKAADGVLMSAHFDYWLASDREVTLSWDGRISGLLYPWPK